MQAIPFPLVQPRHAAHAATRLAAVAQDFEASFLAEMLRAANSGVSAGSFGGGIGEEQFTSFLVDAQAQQFAARGGLGLAEVILRSLMQEHSAQLGDRP